jgi:tetratricopeptide (TPR) repeat protein
MLTGGSRDAPARQRTLRDTFDWSYNLLNDDEQHLFTQLGVFSGGFSLEAEVAICDPGPRYDALDGLESLLNKSLIYKAEAPDGEPRFFMLETIHEYARERLEESREQQLIRNRHLAFFLALAEKAEPHLWESEQVTWLDRLEIEHGNFRAALVWSQRTEHKAESGLRLAGSLGPFWATRGYFKEGREYLSATLSQAEALERTSARARALHAAGLLAYMQSDYPDTNLLIEESLSIYRELGHAGRKDFANALITLGDMKTELGDYTGASSLMTEALGIMRELDDLPGILRALWQLGACAVRPGDLESAIRYLEEALPLARQIGDRTATGIVLTSLAEVAIRQGEYERATAFEEQSLEMRREVGEPWGIAVSLGNFAWIALLQGDLKQAVTLLGESLNLRHEIGDRGGMAWCLEKFAEIVFTQGRVKDPPQRLEDLQRAAQLFGSAQALRAPIGSVMDLVDQPKYAHWIDSMRAQLDEATFDAAWAKGQKMTVDQAVEYALSDSDRENDSIE